MARGNEIRYIQFYTPGSTAVKVDIQDEQNWAPLPEPKKAKKHPAAKLRGCFKFFIRYIF